MTFVTISKCSSPQKKNNSAILNALSADEFVGSMLRVEL